MTSSLFMISPACPARYLRRRDIELGRCRTRVELGAGLPPTWVGSTSGGQGNSREQLCKASTARSDGRSQGTPSSPFRIFHLPLLTRPGSILRGPLSSRGQSSARFMRFLLARPDVWRDVRGGSNLQYCQN